MKDTFDFFNYNYSAMISIFAALMGMAYPLILQAVQRIDEVYQSTLLTKYIQKQSEFKRFNISLIIAVVTSFFSSFIIAVINEVHWKLFVEICHTLTIVYLSYAAIKLFHFILNSNNPDDFFAHITHDGGNDSGATSKLGKSSQSKTNKNLVEIFQIAKYASVHEDSDLYRKCMDIIIPAIQEGIREKKHSKEVWKVMFELCNQLKREKDSLFTSNCFIRDIYFNVDSITYSEDDLKYIWDSLAIISKGDKDSWIYEYWSSADQFFRFRLEENREQVYSDFISRYKEFHIMLGAMLVYNKKFALLGNLLSFTNEFPPRYLLVPGTYADIINSITTIDSYIERPLLLTQRYSIPSMGYDVNTDQKILVEAYRYHALLIIRLSQIPDYWYYIDKYALPDLGEELNVLNNQTRIVKVLKMHINYWYKEGNIDSLNVIIGEIPAIDGVLNLLNKHTELCDNRKEELENSTEIDADKIEYIKNELKENAQNLLVHLPMKEDITLPQDHPCKQSNSQYVSYSIDGEIIRKGNSHNASNLPELIIDQLNRRLYQEYNNFFLLNSATITVCIKFEDIKNAFDLLGINGDYVILSNVYLRTLESIYGNQGKAFTGEKNILFYNNARIFQMTSNTNSILILKKKDVPYINFESVEPPQDLKRLSKDDDSYIYTNIDTIEEALNKIELTVLRGTKIYEPDYHIKYIRLNISHYSNDVSELDKLRTLNIFV